MADQQDTREQILDAAETLFHTKGYDQCSISDIQKAVNIARGTLYYHFTSKEEILDSLIERQSRVYIEKAQAAADEKTTPVLQRLAATMFALNQNSNAESQEILDRIHNPQNALMHEKIKNTILRDITPIFTGIVEEGISEGIFSTPYPHEAMEMMICYINDVFDNSSELSPETFQQKVAALLYNLERMLGVAQGTFDILAQYYK